MRVIFAEKPSMGRSIAAALGLPANGKTCIKGKDKQGRDVTVTWGVGHLVELLGGFEDYNPALKKWTAESLPFIPEQFKTQVIYGSKDQFAEVKKLMLDSAVEDVVVATDPGREGELIALYALQKIGLKKPTLRLWPKSLTDTGITEAYKAMKPWSDYKALQDSAQSRSEADWIVGLNGTRALTLRARGLGFTEKGAWAVGRVMTPTLAILVNRELEIQKFVSKDYWTLEATFIAQAGNYKGKWFKRVTEDGETKNIERFSTQAEAQTVLAKVKGQPGQITELDVREERKNPEFFYDLTDLQREANKRYGYPAAKTLEIAQELYEAKYLSYPRTNSKHLTHQDAAEIPHWLKALSAIPDYAAFTTTIGPKPGPLGKRYVDDDEVEDHHALAPTDKAPMLASLSEEQRRIYDLVARRFMGAFFPARIEEKTTIITEVLGETFKTNGTVVKSFGWSEVDIPSQSKKATKKGAKNEVEEVEDTNGLPAVSKGEQVRQKDITAPAKKTEPPKRMTEADLLLAMKTAGKDIDDDAIKEALKGMGIIGIGTPATRAATIEKLKSKGTPKFPKAPLVEVKGKFLIPTQRGITLIQMVPVEDLKSPTLTGKWEAQLDEIRNHKRQRDAFMKQIHDYTQHLVQQMLSGKGASQSLPHPSTENYMNHEPGASAPGRFEPVQLEKCPKCAGKLWHKAFDGRHYVKCDTADCNVSYDCKEDGSPVAGAPVAGACKITAGCTGAVKTTKGGSLICVVCDKWQNEKPGGGEAPSGGEATTVGPCPKCQKATLYKRNGQYGPFVSCSDRACGYLYNSDEHGEPKYGRCTKPGCTGALKNGTCLICATGGSGATTGDRPPKPADGFCPTCRAKMKTLWTKKQKWAYLCESPCNKWFDVPAGGPK